jgi:hypothetical protein
MNLQAAILIFAASISTASPVSAGEAENTVDGGWHLAVLNDLGKNSQTAAPWEYVTATSLTAKVLRTEVWANHDATWDLQLGAVPPPVVMRVQFGPRDGLPLAGDFNGDGRDELAMYADGKWFVDFNGNECWDRDDLVLHFGRPGDRPIVGDWNGDGKADIGVHTNDVTDKIATSPTAQPYVPQAFQQAVVVCNERICLRREFMVRELPFTANGRIPVVGDWSGCGHALLGTFHDGRWMLDQDGDGRTSDGDVMFQLGRHGDLPIVGDFNRDGRDDVGIWRQGRWYLDISGDRQFGDDDLQFQLGEPGDLPVVGDWDGDGGDQIGIVRQTNPSHRFLPDSVLSSAGR